MSTTAEKVGRVFSIIFALCNAVTFGCCFVGFTRARGHFALMFKDTDLHLPPFTQFVLAIPNGVALFVAFVLLGLLVAKEWLRPVWIPLTLNSVWLALGCVLAFLFVMAMLLPVVTVVAKTQ
jgi:hypothetical protein